MKAVPVYRMTVITDKVVGRFDVAAETIEEALEIAREWAREQGFRPTDISYTPRQEGGLPKNIYIA